MGAVVAQVLCSNQLLSDQTWHGSSEISYSQLSYQWTLYRCLFWYLQLAKIQKRDLGLGLSGWHTAVSQAYRLSTGEVEAEGSGVKVILSQIVNLRPAWANQDRVGKKHMC